MGAMFESICILKQSQSMRALRGLKSGLTLISEDSALVIFYSQVHLMHIFLSPRVRGSTQGFLQGWGSYFENVTKLS